MPWRAFFAAAFRAGRGLGPCHGHCLNIGCVASVSSCTGGALYLRDRFLRRRVGWALRQPMFYYWLRRGFFHFREDRPPPPFLEHVTILRASFAFILIIGGGWLAQRVAFATRLTSCAKPSQTCRGHACGVDEDGSGSAALACRRLLAHFLCNRLLWEGRGSGLASADIVILAGMLTFD